MASLPPRQASQRRSTPEQTSTPNQQQSQPTNSPSPIRTRSEDSQTLFLNSPDNKEEAEAEQPTTEPSQPQEEDTTFRPSPPTRTSTTTTTDIKKCWICFSDSTEDTPTTSPWRNPCPCALVAHEECLLDWIADIESPTSSTRDRGAQNRGNLSGAPRIECPQCKNEIVLSRPRDVIVEVVRGVERAAGQMITPGALTVLGGVIWQSSLTWGVHSIYAVFGAEDGFRILRPLLLNTVRPPLEFEGVTFKQIGRRVLGIAVDHLVHWRLYVGLPLITPTIILSRTQFADSVLPVLPILFFATQTHHPGDTLDFGQWPPSASLAFAVLPYLRSAYNFYYQRVWAEREKKWLKEIQPRVSQNAAEGGGEGAGGDPDLAEAEAQNREEGNLFEVRIDGLWDDDDSEDEEEMRRAVQQIQQDEDVVVNPPPPAGNEAEDIIPPPVPPAEETQQPADAEQAQPPPNIEDNRPAQEPAARQPGQNQPQQPQQNQPANGQAQQAQPQQQPGGERRLSFSPTTIASTVLGALIFPSLAGLSGELLKLALPTTWTTPSGPLVQAGAGAGAKMRVSAKGLLQEKWGRSLVGGCLFVVLKDAVMLYVRWRMVGLHRARRVVDFEGARAGKRR